MKTTLNKIRAKYPCESGWKKLLANLGKTKTDDEPVSITYILDSNGLDDALWCLGAVDGYDKEIRLLAVEYARSVQHLMKDKRSLNALDVAERYANGLATKEELAAAWDAARDAARAAALDAAAGAAWDAAAAAAWAAAWDAAWDAAWAAATNAALDASKEVQADYLRLVCAEIEQREL